MDWSALTPLIASAAPTIGGLLGGFIPFPGGSILGQVAGKVVAEALGVPPTPEAVKEAIETRDPVVVQSQLSQADVRMQAEVEKLKAELDDVQDARSTTVKLAEAKSPIAWGAPVVSVVVVLGFVIFTVIAMRPNMVGADQSVTIYLLAAWQGLATSAAGYWLGSSAGSKDKTDTINALAARPVVKKK